MVVGISLIFPVLEAGYLESVDANLVAETLQMHSCKQANIQWANLSKKGWYI